MLGLLRFNKDGGEREFFTEYPASRSGTQSTPVLTLKGINPIIADEIVDRLILAHYPSADVLTEMTMSAEFRAVSHLRAEEIELALIWPFSMVVN